MIKYEVFDYDLLGNEEEGYNVNDVMPTGIIISTDTSKSSLCKKLGLDDPYKIDVDATNEGVLYVDYERKPYYELREID